MSSIVRVSIKLQITLQHKLNFTVDAKHVGEAIVMFNGSVN